MVSVLTEALVDLGHEVTLFATGDSRTRAQLVACSPRGLRLEGSRDPVARHLNMVEEVFQRADDFDVIHFHIDYLGFQLARRYGIPYVTTLHNRLDLPDWEPLFRTYAEAPLVSISDTQRAPLPFANWQATVYHGLPPDLLPFRGAPGRYLAFLGRVSPEKGLARAVEIARRLDMPLKIAAKIGDEDRRYFEREIEPLFSDRRIEFVGEIDQDHKGGFLGGAAALLFPVEWPEPFGLVMIEAMACGTPVVAFRRGAVPEVMRDGVSGYVVDGVEQAVARTAQAIRLPRDRCRAYFEERFCAGRMARDYLAVYEALAEGAAQGGAGGRGTLDRASGLDALGAGDLGAGELGVRLA